MKLTAKETYELIKERPYIDGEQLIKNYAWQAIEKRDTQWRILFIYEKRDIELIKELPEVELL